eukprot:14287940-Heterocapsa_arctica.AAC.1
MVTAQLRRWIAEHGVETDTISPAEAKTWIATYRHQRQVVRAHQLPSDLAGPSTRQAGLQLKYKLGRNCYKGKNKLSAIMDDQGSVQTNPALIDSVLWNSRKGLWCSAPDTGGASSDVLSAYMIGRTCSLPNSPKPNLHRIAGSVLAAGDSAAGIDGWPYE